jgi:hypothetical protein
MSEDFTKTAAFQEAVNAAVAAAMEKVVSAQGFAPGVASDGWAEKLAHAIASVSHQGGMRRERVDPAVQAKRDAAGKRLVALIADLDGYDEKPIYRLTAQTYLNEELIPAVQVDPISKQAYPTEIEWEGIPNTVMRPVNDIAKMVFAEFVAWTDYAVPREPITIGAVTSKGIVVNQMRQNHASFDSGYDNADTDAPKSAVIRRGSAHGRPVHVLGTIAPPALQN